MLAHTFLRRWLTQPHRANAWRGYLLHRHLVQPVAEPSRKQEHRHSTAIVLSLYRNKGRLGFCDDLETTLRQVFVTQAVGKELTAELDLVTLHKAYERWAPVYDLVFGAVFNRGRRAAVAAAEQVGGRILEVGVGTGISLPGYSRRNRIIGIDLSEAMLRKAQRRVADLSLTNVEKLEVMDAE